MLKLDEVAAQLQALKAEVQSLRSGTSTGDSS